jgi:hypothetical protein
LNFGDLIVLVLFVLFVLLPQLNRAKQQPSPRRPPAQAPQGRQTPAQQAQAPAPTSEGSPPIFSEDLEDEFARRLAAARERVRAAAGDGPAATRTPPPDPKARAAAPLVSGGPSRVGGGTGGPGSVDPRVRARAPLAASSLTPRPRVAGGAAEQRAASGARSRELRRESAPIEVQRLTSSAARTGASGRGDGNLDLGDWRQGFLWHQILSAPRARRRLGGGPFPAR